MTWTGHDAETSSSASWLINASLHQRIRKAVTTLLDVVDGTLNDGFSLANALHGCGEWACEFHGIPTRYAALVETEATVAIAYAIGHRPAGALTTEARVLLHSLNRLPPEAQQGIVRAAAEMYPRLAAPVPPAITVPTVQASTPTPAGSPKPTHTHRR
ncbi:hypothetical protein ACWGCC_03930 [Streptomyces nigrescens]